MAKIQIEITQARADLVQWAVDLSGGQAKAAKILKVTPATVSRWTRKVGPVPEAVIFWAKAVISDRNDIADQI